MALRQEKKETKNWKLKIMKKDTCGITSYTETDYSGYADYADNELFCRWKQNGVLGIVSKDWAWLGAQCPRGEIND